LFDLKFSAQRFCFLCWRRTCALALYPTPGHPHRTMASTPHLLLIILMPELSGPQISEGYILTY
jgi:hypothetical protein